METPKLYTKIDGVEFDLDDLPGEETVPTDVQIRGILKALRKILIVGDGQSILTAAVTLRRRYDQLVAKYGEIA